MIDLESKRQFIWDLFVKYVIPPGRPDLILKYRQAIDEKTQDWVEKAFQLFKPND